MKKIAFLLAAVMIFAMALVGCSTTNSSGQNLSVCVGPEPDTIDPALNSAVDGGTLILTAFEGLMKLDSTGTPVAGQAESYTLSDDGLTYTFTLRDGLEWSDGVAVKASDFIYSWNRAISPDTAADYEYMFDVISGYDTGTLDVTAPDDKTLVVTLNSPVPYFLELCAFPAYYPVRQDIIEANGDQWTLDPSTYVSNGAYKMKEWVHDSYILYEKNPNYWDAENIGPDTIKYVLMDDDNAILSAYEDGSILFADSLPNAELATLSTDPEYHKNGQLGTYYISFNTQKEPFDDPLVRKALTLAIDREFIVTNIGQAGQIPAGAFVPVGMTDADPTQEFRTVGGDYYDPLAYEANLAEAKELLAEAGYPDGEGFPTFEYLYNEGSGHQAIAEALQDMWKTGLGINCELVSQEWNTFLNTRKNGEYEVARNGWLADYNDPITFLDMWTTGGGNNDAQWSNADYDALITQIKSSSDRTERYSLMHQAEDIIFEDSMLCPIYYYVDVYMQSSTLQGFYSTPLGFKYFMYCTIDETPAATK